MESANSDDSETSSAVSVGGAESGIARLHSQAVPIMQPTLNGKLHSNGSLSSISSYR